MAKIFRFLKAFWWHINRGMPKSSLKEIQRRYEICSNCEYFDKKKSQCLMCGCNISTKKIFLNKLAWLDQKCPTDKW